jgi:hypothetical protein
VIIYVVGVHYFLAPLFVAVVVNFYIDSDVDDVSVINDSELHMSVIKMM